MAEATAEFFTWTSLGTLAGASAAVIVVTNTLRKAANLTWPILPLLVALIVVYGMAAYGGQLNILSGWGLAFLNSCLLYCSATGANETLVEVSKGKIPGAEQHGLKPVGLLSSWLRK